MSNNIQKNHVNSWKQYIVELAMNQGNFWLSRNFRFGNFLFCNFLTFYKVTWLDLFPSKFAFKPKDQMKLYEFLLHIKNKKNVLPIKVIFSYITPYICRWRCERFLLISPDWVEISRCGWWQSVVCVVLSSNLGLDCVIWCQWPLKRSP